ncbi:unnamed protein product [Oppiella nova]|uniref:Transcriptional adapter 1-like protein n=1 Tax=Oppiella nova TaxID=334625 RepID=A0A7R9LGE3_9ACAR|nr:unnamed protein product [Oppiella nova]CAG2163419.1 unnamed protein product [Oppiella nova]
MEAMDTSSTASDELVIAKRALDSSLGDNFKKYLRAMRQWFTQQSTKEEFDTEVHHFLTPDSVKAHNRFLLALLNKCSHLETLEDNPSVPDVKPIVADKTPIDTKPVATTTATATEVPVKPKPKPVVKPLNKKLREKQKKVNFENRFDATSEMNNAYIRDMRFFDDSQKLSKVSYCQRESLLPDHLYSVEAHKQ